jgi:hypothetical protein
MIYSSFEGRIGNNLFQLAACLSLANRHQTEAVAGLSANLRFIKENFILKNIKFIDIGDPNGFNYRHRLPENIIYTYREQSFQYNEDFFKIADNSVIDGFFQSEKYFKSISDIIRRNFTFKQHIINSAKNISYFNPLAKDSGFIHIRRQDYIEGEALSVYPQPPINYYIDCIKESNLKTIYIFSDDINWCINNFKNFDDKKFIPVMEENPYICLYMMSKLDTAIITNSTFSWWGAWLNNKINTKRVYYPIPWYGSCVYEKHNLTAEEYIRDLPCEKWIGKKWQ